MLQVIKESAVETSLGTLLSWRSYVAESAAQQIISQITTGM
jgi:hypothetical protein